jgi:hypothetical protein
VIVALPGGRDRICVYKYYNIDINERIVQWSLSAEVTVFLFLK